MLTGNVHYVDPVLAALTADVVTDDNWLRLRSIWQLANLGRCTLDQVTVILIVQCSLLLL